MKLLVTVTALAAIFNPIPSYATGGSLSACSIRTSFRDVPCSEVDRALRETTQEFGIDEARFRKLARCESGFDPFNSNRSYGGIFQHSKIYWAGRVRVFNKNYSPPVLGNIESVFDNARVTGMMISRGGWNPWPICGRA